MWLFYLLALIVIWQGAKSLLSGFRYLAYFHRELARAPSAQAPFVSIFVPFRGLDQGLEENLRALFAFDYPAYELVFATGKADDPAIEIIDRLRAELQSRASVTSQIVIAGKASDSGQKVHNLREAVTRADPRSEVFVFVDTDARPTRGWLRSLITPVLETDAGAATGYRWFVPVRRGISSHLRAIWNASTASALGEDGARNFCWGGATAIRRATFERLEMREKWRGTVSDDFAMMRALHAEGLRIHFVPQCLTPSLEDCTFRQLIEFTTRQLKITRVYASHFWVLVLIGSSMFSTVFCGGIVLAVAQIVGGLRSWPQLAIVGVIFLLGAGKALVRQRAVSLVIPAARIGMNVTTLAQALLWPFAALIYLFNSFAALCSRKINWRGTVYLLKSATETVIISRTE